jgi:hypothetical protein
MKQTDSVPIDDLLPWFERNYQAAVLASRTAANVAAQMYGALTTGQAATRNIGIGACVKHELDDGLLERLTQFRLESLSADQLGDSGPLADLAEAVSEAIEFVDENRRGLMMSTYRDHRLVSEAERRLGRVASAIDSVVDFCTARLIEQAG